MVVERADGTIDSTRALPVEEFEARLGPVLTEEERDADIDTVGGLVFTLAGRVPAKGEVISHPSGLEFRVLDADPRRIRRLRVRRPGAQAQRSRSRRRSREPLAQVPSSWRQPYQRDRAARKRERRMPFKGKPPGSGSGEMSRRTQALRPAIALNRARPPRPARCAARARRRSAIAAHFGVPIEEVEKALVQMRSPRPESTRGTLNVTLAAHRFVMAERQGEEPLWQTMDRLWTS